MPISSELKQQILNYIKQPIPQNDKMPIVERSIPIPFFGDIENARVATISINPSFREFQDKNKNLLKLSEKRFVDREDLAIQDTDTLNDLQANLVYDSLLNYFNEDHKPYKSWFNWLDKYAGNMLKASYYNGSMVHLDIYPWATKEKWSDLDEIYRERALQNYNLLKGILKEQSFDYVYINGKEVKEQLEKYFETKIIENKQGQWTIYKYKLGNKTMFIGSSCYLKNAHKTRKELVELHNILSHNKQYMRKGNMNTEQNDYRYRQSLRDDILSNEDEKVVEEKLVKMSKEDINAILCSVGARATRASTIDLMVKYGADVNAVIDEFGNTNLRSLLVPHYSKHREHLTKPQIVESFIKHGVEINVEDKDILISTPLMYAVEYNEKLEIIRALVELGADVNAHGSEGLTPLMYVANYHQNPELVQILVEHGADVNAQDNKGWTALMFASMYNENPEVAKMLLKYGAEVNAKTKNGWTPFMLASKENHNPEVIKVLLKNGADVNIKDKDNRTPLMRAIKFNQDQEKIKIMLEYGADVNAKAEHGWTALLYAARDNQNPEIIKMLVKYGADINAQYDKKQTPLIYAAASNKNPEIIKTLINLGANVNAGDIDGITPLMYAIRYNQNSEIVRVLIELGADINAKDTTNKTALNYAEEQENKEIADFINFLNKPINFVDTFSVRTARGLENNNIYYVKDLLGRTAGEYIKFPNFCKKSLHEVQNFLSCYGLSLRQQEKKDDNPVIKNPELEIPTIEDTDNIEKDISMALDTLTVQEKDILIKFFGLNCSRCTFTKIAEQYNVSSAYIAQVARKALRKLKHPTRSSKLRKYYYIDNLFRIYGNILNKSYSYINLVEEIFGGLNGNYLILYEINNNYYVGNCLRIPKNNDTLYIKESSNFDLSVIASCFDSNKYYSDENLHFILEDRVKNLLNATYKEHYSMVTQALVRILKKKYFRCTKDGYKVSIKKLVHFRFEA